MKILVACEESQAVTIELRRLGHEAYSCDIEPCSGGHPEWHLQVDALELLKCYSAFCMVPPHHIFIQIKIRYTINYSDREYIRLIYAVPFVLS